MALSKILPASQEQYVGARNLIVNGNFAVWQRNTDSETTSTSWAYRTVDRFQINRGRYRKTSDTVDGRTVDVVQIDPASGAYHGGRGMFTKIEDYNVYDKPTVFSVYVKADAATTAEIGQLYDYGGGSTVQAGTSVNITTDWQRFEVQYSAQTFSQVAANYIVNALVDGRTYYVAMAQLEEGTQATPFEHRLFGDELARCKRYFNQIKGATGGFSHISSGVMGVYNSGNQGLLRYLFPTEMRAVPTVTFSALSTYDLEPFDTAPSAISSGGGTTKAMAFNVTDPSSRTKGFAMMLTMDQTAGYIKFDSEL